MTRQIIIKLMRQLPQLRQPCPRHSGKVVVLVVQTYIVGQVVERAIVGVGLFGLGDSVGRTQGEGGCGVGSGGRGGCGRGRRGGHDVVLGDEVPSYRVQAAREEGAPNQIAEGTAAGVLDQEDVEDNLHRNVEEMQGCQRHVVNKHRSQCVEEDLTGAEECFSSDRVEEERFEGGGEVGVEAVHAKGFVVREVVGAETRAVGDADWEVGEDSEVAVRLW